MEIGQASMADLDSVPSDLHGPASYRKRVGAALVASGVAARDQPGGGRDGRRAGRIRAQRALDREAIDD